MLMPFWNKKESRDSNEESQGKGCHWDQNEELSSELIQDHIFKCYDREER